MSIDTYNIHCQFISKAGAYRGQFEKITIIITSIGFISSYLPNFLIWQNWKYNLEKNLLLKQLHEVFNSLCFLVNESEYLSQAVTPWKCTCPRQGCWCHGSCPGKGLQLKSMCIWFNPVAEKLDEAVFSPSRLQRHVIRATALAWQIGKCQC